MAIDNIDGVDSMKTGTTNRDLVQSTALHRQSVRLALKGECDFLLILLNFLYPSCSAVDFFNQPDCFRPERLLTINLGHIVRTFELLWSLDHFWIIVIPKKLVSRLNRGGVEVLLSTWTLPDRLLGETLREPFWPRRTNNFSVEELFYNFYHSQVLTSALDIIKLIQDLRWKGLSLKGFQPRLIIWAPNNFKKLLIFKRIK